MVPITITISGGDAFQRDVLASEIYALLESVKVGVTLERALVALDGDEHDRQLNHVTHNVIVTIRREP